VEEVEEMIYLFEKFWGEMNDEKIQEYF